jgi:hypothetical protein
MEGGVMFAGPMLLYSPLDFVVILLTASLNWNLWEEKSESESELLYDWRVTANQFVLAQKQSPAFILFDTDRIENDTSNNSSFVVCICCRGNVSTELLLSNGMRDTHTETHRLMGGIYEVRRSDAMIYISSFIKIGSAIQNLIAGIISLLLFFQNK